MKQLMETEQYIGLVRQLGIEEAYKQRHRATGRTVRNILDLAMHMSLGKKIHIVYRDAPAQNRQTALNVMHRVTRICTDLGMQHEQVCKDAVYFPQSGGRMHTIEEFTPGLVPGWELYYLHEC